MWWCISSPFSPTFSVGMWVDPGVAEPTQEGGLQVLGIIKLTSSLDCLRGWCLVLQHYNWKVGVYGMRGDCPSLTLFGFMFSLCSVFVSLGRDTCLMSSAFFWFRSTQRDHLCPSTSDSSRTGSICQSLVTLWLQTWCMLQTLEVLR